MIQTNKNVKAITNIPGWVEQMQAGGKVTNESQSYDLVPLVYRAVNLRCNSLTAIPYTIKKDGEPIEVLPWQLSAGVRKVSFKRLLWLTEAALLIAGASYWLEQANDVRSLGFQWLNPTTVTPQVRQQELIFSQTADFGKGVAETKDFTQEEIVYFSEFNIAHDIEPGQSAVGVSLGDAQLLHFMKRYSVHFFEGGAVPITLLSMQGNPSPEEINRTEGFFRRKARGVKNLMSVLGLSSAIDVKTLTPPVSDLAMPELKESSVDSVSDAFSIPLAMLRDSSNRATAISHRQSFYTETVVPRANEIAETINRFWEGTGYTLEFRPNEMDIFQTDEASRSGALFQVMQSITVAEQGGLPPEKMMVAFDMLGYDLTDEQRETLLKLPEPKPETEDAEPDESTETDEPDNDDSQIRADLSLWQKKATKRAKAGKGGLVEFNSDAIPLDEQYAIIAYLGHCETPQQVINAFAEGFKVTLGEPDDIDPDRLKLEKKFISPIFKFLGDAAGRIGLEVARNGGQAPDTNFYREETQKLNTFLLPFVATWAEFSISKAAELLNTVGLGLDADVNAVAANWSRRHSLKLARGLTKTTRALAKARITNFLLEEGRPLSELSDELAKVIGPKWRAELIAQTEITRALGQGNKLVANEVEAIKGLRWLTLADERVCVICGPLNGVKIDKDDTFPGGYEFPPAHPRCRCGLGLEV